MNDDSAEPSVIAITRGRLGHLRLNRPRAINALDIGMVRILRSRLDEWATDDTVETVVITGAGDRGLCAGGDIVGIYHDAIGGSGGGTRASETFWREEYELNALIARYPKPYVAIQTGVVLGGGIGISTHGSIRVVTETSKLGMPETGIGFVPDVGGAFRLARAPGELGTHLALTASMIGAADAILVGLADVFVASARIPALLEALEAEDARAAVARCADAPPPGRLAAARAWIDEAYRGDDVALIVGRLSISNEADAREAHAAIVAKSPTSLKAALSALRRASRAESLEDVLEQDFRVSLRFLDEHDLAEGIRAQVIDKDRSPHWLPATLDGVDDDHVDDLFAPLGERELDLHRKERR